MNLFLLHIKDPIGVMDAPWTIKLVIWGILYSSEVKIKLWK